MAGMDPDVLRLADALDDLAAFLAAHGEPSWAEWVAQDAGRVRRADGYGVIHFLSAFGGMGSLNDVVFNPLNDNASGEEASELNEGFERLRSAAWRQATALRHDAQ
jgi:hypothetical protein